MCVKVMTDMAEHLYRHLPRRYLAQKGQEQQRRRPAVTSSPDDRFCLDAGEQDSSPAASEGEDEDRYALQAGSKTISACVDEADYGQPSVSCAAASQSS